MKVVNRPLVASFSGRVYCEWCRQVAWGGAQAHHIFGRGAGRVDIPGNLIALCIQCHADVHAGNIGRYDLLAVAATRERTTQDKIDAEVQRIRRLDKWGNDPRGTR